MAWLTGFTGSAGLAIVLVQEAAVFVDGRYTLQAAKQVDPKAWQLPIWQALDFEVSEPSLFQYRYHSDGQTAVVEAVGDLDCDTQMITYRLDVTAPNGNPRTVLTEPAPHYYQVMTRSDRMPVLIGGRI